MNISKGEDFSMATAEMKKSASTGAQNKSEVVKSGYGVVARPPREEERLTHVGFGTPMGELLRRFWQPICLSEELRDLPMRVTILGEELVAFRDLSGRVGVLDAHCAHRGASLEYGRLENDGIRCCYHGWYFGRDGRCLETPGEPKSSTYYKEVTQPAYPVREYCGLVFIYMGPPDKQPVLPRYDSLEQEGVVVTAYRNYSRGIVADCNWLQIQENAMDPVHTAFLHSTISKTQFTKAYAVIPEMNFEETKYGMKYIRTAVLPNKRTFTRQLELFNPNVRAVAEALVSNDPHVQKAPVIGWWVPVDDTHTIGFHLEALRVVNGKPVPSSLATAPVGRTAAGNAPRTSYEDTQREPDDCEAQVSQRPIAIHALEHRGTTDGGVVMCRKLLLRALKDIEEGREPFGLVTKERDQLIEVTAGNVIRPAPGE
jgi:phenylpropionate dioxygenase-like ring-hydroxylating dioxygenase large terminal subunit